MCRFNYQWHKNRAFCNHLEIHAYNNQENVPPARTILPIHLNQRTIDPFAINLSICYVLANVFIILVGSCFMILLESMDLQTGISCVISALMNIGPGFGDVGPAENFAQISPPGKWFLAWLMLIGRLEMFTALVLLFPFFLEKIISNRRSISLKSEDK